MTVPSAYSKICRLCGRELRLFERPEGFCNACLIDHSTRPVLPNPEPRELKDPDLGRLDFALLKEVPDG